MIPQKLKNTPQWLCYRLVDVGTNRFGKPPVSPKSGVVCAKNDESNFVELRDALEAKESFDCDGVGFVLSNGFMGIDLDDCFTDDGVLSSTAQDIFDHFTGTYAEYSPSGNGIHIFCQAKKPNTRSKDSALHVEVYDGFNFMTVTGDHINGSASDVAQMQDAVNWLFETYLPEVVVPSSQADIVIDHGVRAPEDWLHFGLDNDARLANLYNNTHHDGDESAQDMSLLMKLAYWQNRDADAVKSAFLGSPWVETKDVSHKNKVTDRSDYLENSIKRAVVLCQTTACENDRKFRQRALTRLTPSVDENGDIVCPIEHFTDMENAKLLAEIYSDVLCYTDAWGWCFFNGVVYETGVLWRAMDCAMDLADAIMESADKYMEMTLDKVYAVGLSPRADEAKSMVDAAKQYHAHAQRTQSLKGLEAMIKVSRAILITPISAFDSDPWIINTPSCIVSLKTGEKIPHDPRYKCTSCTTYDADSDSKKVLLNPFLNQIFCNDAALIDYVQMQVGVSLVGKVYSEGLIIANGTGQNGKSTFFGALQSVLGEYACSIDPNLLMSTRVNEQQLGISMLYGKRLAIAQETEEGQVLSTSMLKRLASTDKVVGKRLYHDPTEFTPSHTLVLSTNHLPKVSSTDTGTWRRLIVVPFNAVIKAESMVLDFQDTLISVDGGALLQWAVDGAIKFWENDCTLPDKPPVVETACKEYRSEEDWLENFLNDCFVVNEVSFVTHTEMFAAYSIWARQNGALARTSISLGKSLANYGVKGEQRYYDSDTGKVCKVWFGLQSINKMVGVVPQKKRA